MLIFKEIKTSMKRRLKRLAMDLDSSQCCKKCGIMQDSSQPSSSGNKRTDKAKLCGACGCIESGEIMTKTPCGQQYCKSCGFLVDDVYALSSGTGARGDVAFCFACCLKQAAFLGPDDVQTRTCECDFCSNHYDDNLSRCKVPRLSIKQPFQIEKSQSKQEVRSCTATEIVDDERQNKHLQGFENETVMGESSSDRFLSLVLEEIRNAWEKEQLALKKRLVMEDFRAVREIRQAIERDAYPHEYFIAGVDISFIKGNEVDACAALTVISFPSLELVYKRMQMVKITAPYIPGFLAFREVDSIKALYLSLMENAPQYKPDIIFVDGNGQLHPRGFGLACHLGVTLDLPCVGVAKTLIHVDGIEDDRVHKNSKLRLQKAGDTFPLIATGGECLGAALRSTDAAHNPVYVSVGHKISLASALSIVQKCCKYRVPEPTRQADILSREYLMAGKTETEEVVYGKNGT